MFPMNSTHFSWWAQDTHCFLLFLLSMVVSSVTVYTPKTVWSQVSSKDTAPIAAHPWQCRGCQCQCPGVASVLCHLLQSPPDNSGLSLWEFSQRRGCVICLKAQRLPHYTVWFGMPAPQLPSHKVCKHFTSLPWAFIACLICQMGVRLLIALSGRM